MYIERERITKRSPQDFASSLLSFDARPRLHGEGHSYSKYNKQICILIKSGPASMAKDHSAFGLEQSYFGALGVRCNVCVYIYIYIYVHEYMYMRERER